MAFSHDGHRAVLADFLRAVRTGAAPRVSGAEALKVHRLIDALIETGRTGRRCGRHSRRSGTDLRPSCTATSTAGARALG